MTAYEIPPLLIDSRALPPLLLTSEPGSFAHNTLKVRLPRLLADTIQANAFPPPVREAVEALREEILHGRIRALGEDTPDKNFWNSVSRDFIGRTWLDVPWYWAEAYTYRRLLEATRYFQPGPMQSVDPFAAIKRTELAPEAAPATVEATLRDLPADPQARFYVLLYSSLWGNRTDLSYNVAASLGRAARLADERVNLLVDDAERVWEFLRAGARPRLVLIADNAGTELLADLALIDFLLGAGLAEQAMLHVKPQPFFVSDAAPWDVDEGLAALAGGGVRAQALAERLRAHRAEGRLVMYTNWSYATSLFYFQPPSDLLAAWRAADWVIVKGDANYRRLIGDAHWDPATPFARAAAYFPAPLVALRTLKAELIVGLQPGEAARLAALDPEWMTNGRRGLVQARF